MEFQLENPLPTDTTDPSSLFFVESDHMPSEKYAGSLRFGDFDVAVRQETIGLISQLCSRLDRLVWYLSVNYLDRFLSRQKLPQTKPWALRLIAMSCVSLATKMQGVNLSRSDLQGNGGLIFDSGTLQRMEVLILGALKWRMRSITPFSFVPFFMSLFQLKNLPLRQALKGRATDIIFRAQTDINLLGFKPSIIAASALLRASNQLFPLQFSSFRDAICGCSYVNKDHLDRCYGKMQQVAIERYESAHDSVSRSDTPSNVLDQQFKSTSDSERTGSTSGRALKRRKTSGSASSVLT
uniref:Cyclin-D6-like protein n=1 Tax=Lagerstroemia indica TaxID=141186 RepID=A0A7U1BKG0_9MYRT|nr:cyclin-D6-like protein [Lagerstroemia indica]